MVFQAHTTSARLFTRLVHPRGTGDVRDHLCVWHESLAPAGDGAVPRQAPLSTVPTWALAAAEALVAAE
jgi:hypothetical protein